MSEQLFELIIHYDESAIDSNTLESKLAILFDDPIKCHDYQEYLERELEKAALSADQSHVVKSDLTKAQVEHYQKIFQHLGIRSSVKIALGLEAIVEEVIINNFTCPACQVKQEVKKGMPEICIECGVVKEKYDLRQKQKKLEADRLKQIRLIEAQNKIKAAKTIEEVNEEFFIKQLNKHQLKKKTDPKLWVLLSTVVAGSALVSYLNWDDNKHDIVNNIEDQIEKSEVSTAPNTNKTVINQSDALTQPNNPYKQLASKSMPALTMKEGVQHINTLLQKNNNHLEASDKHVLQDISIAYKQEEQKVNTLPDYTMIKNKAKLISNKEVKSEILKKAYWGEIENGLKTFNQLGIDSFSHKDKEARSVDLISMYIKNREFDKASNTANKISDPYLKVVALNTIMEKQAHLNKNNGVQYYEKILKISQQDNLNSIQKTLVLGILGRSEVFLNGKESANLTMKKVQNLVNSITDKDEKIATLLQLSEDQREGLNLSYAHFFLEEAANKMETIPMSVLDRDQSYSDLAQRYLKLFDFQKVNSLANKINDYSKKLELEQMIKAMEKKISL